MCFQGRRETLLCQNYSTVFGFLLKSSFGEEERIHVGMIWKIWLGFTCVVVYFVELAYLNQTFASARRALAREPNLSSL